MHMLFICVIVHILSDECISIMSYSVIRTVSVSITINNQTSIGLAQSYLTAIHRKGWCTFQQPSNVLTNYLDS